MGVAKIFRLFPYMFKGLIVCHNIVVYDWTKQCQLNEAFLYEAVENVLEKLIF